MRYNNDGKTLIIMDMQELQLPEEGSGLYRALRAKVIANVVKLINSATPSDLLLCVQMRGSGELIPEVTSALRNKYHNILHKNGARIDSHLSGENSTDDQENNKRFLSEALLGKSITIAGVHTKTCIMANAIDLLGKKHIFTQSKGNPDNADPGYLKYLGPNLQRYLQYPDVELAEIRVHAGAIMDCNTDLSCGKPDVLIREDLLVDQNDLPAIQRSYLTEFKYFLGERSFHEYTGNKEPGLGLFTDNP